MVDTSVSVPELPALPGTLTRRAIGFCPNCGYAPPGELVRNRFEPGAATARFPACEQTVISLAEKPVTPSEVAVMNRSADRRRDLKAAALRLKGKIETGDYNVFLCRRSRENHRVVAIGEQIKDRRLSRGAAGFSTPGRVAGLPSDHRSPP